ncbi:MAG: Rv1733c family protein [Streptosporangiaceae bacterium]
MRVRRLSPDRNPLRRATDRAESAAVALLLIAFLIAAPLTALAALDWAATSGLRAEQAQAGRHQVPAVLLHDAPSPAGSLEFPAPAPQALGRWAGPAGPRTGLVYAPPGARAGSTVMVWIDRSGRLTGEPVAVADVAGLEFLAAVAAPGVLSLLLVVIWAYAEIFLDWRRMAAWDADWAATEPQWTGAPHRGCARDALPGPAGTSWGQKVLSTRHQRRGPRADGLRDRMPWPPWYRPPRCR